MRFDIGAILGIVALVLALANLVGIGGSTVLAVAVLLLALAYLVPVWAGNRRWT